MSKIINKQNVKIFFQERAKTHNKVYPLKSVIYQDKNPSLAKDRDAFEKKKIISIINFSKNDVVLDVGCGIGRWAGEICDKVKKYVGIDYIEEFINISNSIYKNKKNTHFICLDGAKLLNPKVKPHSPFTIIMFVGFFMYIDDHEAYDVLKQVLKVSCQNSQIIIREPIGIEKEVVLNNVWSEEMETYYSAKYRTCDYFKKMFKDILYNENYKLTFDDALFPNNLNNRTNTRQHLFCLKRMSK
jgi:SAM-dependent methyltransferase